ncbi:hypothetical protein [Pseudalkalibacillus sp. NRS-1564]
MKKSWIISTTITIALIFLLMISSSKNILEELKIGLDLQGDLKF